MKAEQYAAIDDAAKPEADEAKEADRVAVDIDSDPEQTKAVHPQTKFS